MPHTPAASRLFKSTLRIIIHYLENKMAAVTAAKSSAFLSGSKTIVQAPRASARRVSFRFVALLGHFPNHLSLEDSIFVA
jgi:hypothetical protein